VTLGFQKRGLKADVTAGFALIEILVATSVLAISLVVILQLFSGGLKSRKLSEEYARGIFHAREKMAEMLLLPDLTEGEIQGKFDDDYEWQAVATLIVPEEEEENLPFDVMDIKINVRWREGEKEKQFAVDTLRLVEKKKETGDSQIFNSQ